MLQEMPTMLCTSGKSGKVNAGCCVLRISNIIGSVICGLESGQ